MTRNSLPNRATRFPPASVEMRDAGVPWLGQVPAHWRVVRVGLVGSVLMGRQRAPQYEKGDHPRPYLRVANVLDGVIDYSDVLEMNFEPEEQLLFGLAPGDILLNEGQSRELVGRSAVYRGEPGAYCFQNTLIRFRVHDDLDPEFAQTQFASWLSLGAFQLFCRQSTNIAHLGADRLAQMHMAVPPFEEQRAIVRYIKGETKPIDALLEAKQRLLDLLAEKRKAIIATAVTRGLDPKVKLRDSGVPWLGEVPAHWKVVPFRWYFRIGSGEFIATNEVVAEPDVVRGIPVIGGNGVAGYATSANTVDPLSIVVGRVGAQCGNVHVVTGAAWVTDNALLLRDIRRYDVEYLTCVLRQRDLNSIANKTAQPLITGSMVTDLRGPLPPLDEQHAIVEHIARETAKLDAVRAATERTIALLKERRSALIAAAVTGQLDVGPAA